MPSQNKRKQNKPLGDARANRFGRQLIQKIRSVQGKKSKKVQNGNVTQQQQENETGVANPAFDPFYADVKVEKHVLNTIDENNELEFDVDASLNNESVEKKTKKRKRADAESGLENPNFVLNDSVEETKPVKTKKIKNQDLNESEGISEPIKTKKKKAKKSVDGFVNEGLDLSVENGEESKKKKSKNNKHTVDGFVNAALDLSVENGEESHENNTMEVQRAEKTGLENQAFETSTTDEQNLSNTDGELLLNVTATPVVDNNNINNRNGLIFPRSETRYCNVEKRYKNVANYPSVGEPDLSDGENAKVEDGIKLKFKYAAFEKRSPWYHLKVPDPKKSYRNLIQGDIIVAFNNTNLHEIEGYASRKIVRNQTKNRPIGSTTPTKAVKSPTFPTKRNIPLQYGRPPKNWNYHGNFMQPHFYHNQFHPQNFRVDRRFSPQQKPNVKQQETVPNEPQKSVEETQQQQQTVVNPPQEQQQKSIENQEVVAKKPQQPPPPPELLALNQKQQARLAKQQQLLEQQLQELKQEQEMLSRHEKNATESQNQQEQNFENGTNGEQFQSPQNGFPPFYGRPNFYRQPYFSPKMGYKPYPMRGPKFMRGGRPFRRPGVFRGRRGGFVNKTF